MSLVNPFEMPGMGTPSETTEREFLWGNIASYQFEPGVIVSTAVDSGNTPTTTLRPGLLLGKVTATGKWKQYDSTATDGSEVCQGVLRFGVNMLDSTNTAVDHQGVIVIAGNLKQSQLITIDSQARRQLANRFIFDDDLCGLNAWPRKIVAKTADYTVLASENGTLFTTRGAVGAVNFTLPTLAKGLQFSFFNEADQNMTITAAAADTMVVFNDLAADSIAFSTASEKIGAMVDVYANDNASKWLTRVSLGAETQTPTIAT